MSITQEKKQRKRKVRKGQTISARRNADRASRARRRKRTERRERMRQHFKFKIKVVRCYRQLREQVSKQRAVELTLARWQPTKSWHFPLCTSSIRQWHRAVGQDNNWAAIRPQSTRPKHIRYQVSERVVGISYTLRSLLGWGGHRIAAELKAREIAQVSGQTVYNIFTMESWYSMTVWAWMSRFMRSKGVPMALPIVGTRKNAPTSSGTLISSMPS